MELVKEEYLPGSARDRFKDIRDREKLTQEQLAEIAGVQVSTISKIESGKTTKIASTILERIADHFHITTDFLLGRVDIPEKTSYQIEQLGLSVEAAKNLYTGKVNPEVMNALLENKKFAALTYNVECYFEEKLAQAFAAQNQMMMSVSKLLRNNGIEDGAKDVLALRDTQVSTPELEKLSKEFVACLRDIKAARESTLPDTRRMIEEDFNEMLGSVTANSQKSIMEVTPKDILNVIKNSIWGNLDYLSTEQIDNLMNALEPLFAPGPEKERHKNDE